MRIALFVAVFCLAVLCTQSVPIQQDQKESSPVPSHNEALKPTLEETPQIFVTPTSTAVASEKLKETGRQSSSDDDDDDDDDDLDLGVDDDDDDDDDDSPGGAADDDDDDDDYFESFFDDILGEDDDDDDDDDDDTPAAAAQPEASPPEPPVQEVIEEDIAEETPGETDNPIEGQSADGGLIEKDPETAQSVSQPVVVQPVPADDDEEEEEEESNTADDDDDDDDDDDEEEEDDVEGELDDLAGGDDDDDDDDDDEAADDDDDDDDDDEGDLDDVIEAKRSRSIINTNTQQRVPAIYIAKYNRFVDNILGRINRILGKSYDPVRVKLQSLNSSKSKKKSGSSKNKKKKSSNKRRKTIEDKMGDVEIARMTESESREPAFILISKTSDIKGVAGGTLKNVTVEVRARPVPKKKVSSATSSSNKSKNKPKQNTNTNSKPKATLFGLSTLRRDGDVIVTSGGDSTTVKTNFILGPLTLRVEKEFGRGSKRQVKSATATTAEMYGKLNLKIVHGGAATLSSIKVLQPKQVRVDSADDHEKTKEYMWKRSSHIASVVSKKLASAAKSMLKPPPRE